jgi:hypothetical protein
LFEPRQAYGACAPARKLSPALDVAEANMHFDRKPFAETKVRTTCVKLPLNVPDQ